MKSLLPLSAALMAGFLLASPAPAGAATPQQIQAQIANGQVQPALSELQSVLNAHPDSGVAWYLTAEAQDAAGNEAAARTAFANAQHYAPGLPFARPSEVAALQSHLSGNGQGGMAVRQHSGISGVLVGIIGLVVLFLVIRMLFRPRRRFMMPGTYPTRYGQAPGPYPYGSGPGFGGPGFGGGLGSSLMGGLAAGAGFAAGERVIDDVFGRNNNTGWDANAQPDPNFGNPGVPDRDDGLQGNPGWDDGSNQDDNFYPGNNW